MPYLVKPFEVGDLIAHARRLLQKAQAAITGFLYLDLNFDALARVTKAMVKKLNLLSIRVRRSPATPLISAIPNPKTQLLGLDYPSVGQNGHMMRNRRLRRSIHTEYPKRTTPHQY